MKPSILWLAYVANIVILVPVTWSMLTSGGTVGVFQGKLGDTPGLRLLVGSLWLAILLASIAGLVAPRFFVPVLLVQIVYKATWLLVFVLPLGLRSGWNDVPAGIAITFAAIVVTYPIIAWFGLRT